MSVFEAKITAGCITGNDINPTAIDCEVLVETLRQYHYE
jgi:hypothetical protein